MPETNSHDPPFGHQLRQLRRTKQLTLKDVEAMTGIHNAYLSQVENGKIARPAPDKLYALAEVYDVSFDQLMYASGHIAKQPHISPQGSEPKTLVGAVLSSKNLTAEEETELAKYLEFLRARK